MAGGVEILVRREDIAMPRTCAGCGGAPFTRRVVPGSIPIFGQSMMSVPYCQRCVGGGEGDKLAIGMFIASAVIAIAVALLVKSASQSWALVALLAVAITMFATGALAAILPRRARGRVESRGTRDGRIALFIENEAWANELLARSGGAIVQPRRFAVWPNAVAVVAACALAPLVALLGWRSERSILRVDNAARDPILIWIDGRPAEVVDARPDEASPSEIFVVDGTHELGYSAVDAQRPQATVRASIHSSSFVYNPGQTACYVELEDVYSRHESDQASRFTVMQRRELYERAGVDNWFRNNPDTVDLSSSQSTATRIAFARYQSCTYLVQHGCPATAITRMIDCAQAATDNDALRACDDEAMASCGGAQ